MVNKATYLGITITGNNSRKIFQTENEEVLVKANKSVNMVIGEVRKKCR